MTALHEKPAVELAQMIASKTLSPTELLIHFLERIQALNPKINAFVGMRGERAQHEARNAEKLLADGKIPPPLIGIPIGVKDLEDVAGMVTSFGSTLFKNNVAKQDALHVSRLRAAGAIVVGKTNTPEFGYTFSTKNRLYGATRNPWDLTRTPGGSSGGSAAAVAAAMVPAATGSDAGGSIRAPASFTGCFGLKPTHGRIPLPQFPGPLEILKMHAIPVLGYLTGFVQDTALLLDCTAGYHPSDPLSLPKPPVSYLGVLKTLPKNLKIAFSPDLGYARVESSVLDPVQRAAGFFEELGYSVEPWSGRLPDVGSAWVDLLNCDFFAQINAVFESHPAEFNRGLVPVLEAAAGVDLKRRIGAQSVLTELNRRLQELFEHFDLLITPTMPVTAFDAKGQPPGEIDGHPVPLLGIAAFTCPFNFSGHPAASVPVGTTPEGLPVGMQLTAERHREDLLLQVCHAFETARPWRGSRLEMVQFRPSPAQP